MEAEEAGERLKVATQQKIEYPIMGARDVCVGRPRKIDGQIIEFL
jgi:hypothetical protein